ncbi:hypothetical protein [Streptomyces sp. NPDC048720]|uniref:hypothetical protein n=1 Tax=Streptomyces sp. NPDC048720 TaxID=3365588 RepID=UPI003723199E
MDTSSNGRPVRLEIVERGPGDVPELLNLIPAQIHDHDSIAMHPVKSVWPSNLAPSSLKMHQHFCELLMAWNINPFRSDPGTAAVDGVAETSGITRFSFTSRESMDAFIHFYGLRDFIVEVVHAKRSDSFHFLTLTNKFLPSDVEKFFTVYRECMMNLTSIQEERMRALRVDGGKIGHAFADHFAARETNELMRIRHARTELGAGHAK